MTCKHCKQPIQRCTYPRGCDFRGYVHIRSGFHPCGSLSGPFAQPAVAA